ncbi:hypothetical protein CLV63_118146, partial [Murinocardiopsis flavida]
TDLDNLQPLCAAHNLAKEHRRAAHERRTRTHRNAAPRHTPQYPTVHPAEDPPTDPDPPPPQ